MNPTIALAISQGIAALIEIWRQQADKPADWTPSDADWAALLAFNTKTASDYKAEAAARLGVPWPPKIEDPLPPHIPEM